MYFISKLFYIAISYFTACTVVHAITNDVFLNDCENTNFNNRYYLVDDEDIAAVSVFFRQIPMDTFSLESRFLVLKGRRNRDITYYDYDDLNILNANKALFHIAENYLPEYRVDKRKVKFIDRSSSVERIKSFSTKSYNKKVTPFDKHPLFGVIKRKERPILIDSLLAITNDAPNSISESLKISSDEDANLITRFGISYSAVTLSHFTILDYNIPNISFLVSFEIFHGLQDKLTQNEKMHLNNFLCNTVKQFQSQFPHIQASSWFGYNEYYNLAKDVLPSLIFFRKHPLLFTIGQIISLTIIGFLFIFLILGRYSKQSDYRKVFRS